MTKAPEGAAFEFQNPRLLGNQKGFIAEKKDLGDPFLFLCSSGNEFLKLALNFSHLQSGEYKSLPEAVRYGEGVHIFGSKL